ncbi:hypothetical protein ABIE53_004307 [Burkholderia sp. OAS925]
MKRFFSSSVSRALCRAVLAIAAGALPLAVYAAALDAPLACNETGHQFIADLAGQQLIDPKPTRVESNSINAFSPAQGADLSAFGFHVFAVVGYEKDDPMFRVGDGEPVARSAYGVVVFGERIEGEERGDVGRRDGDRAPRGAAHHGDLLQAELRRRMGAPRMGDSMQARAASGARVTA